jgi:hypothetical protein
MTDSKLSGGAKKKAPLTAWQKFLKAFSKKNAGKFPGRMMKAAAAAYKKK